MIILLFWFIKCHAFCKCFTWHDLLFSFLLSTVAVIMSKIIRPVWHNVWRNSTIIVLINLRLFIVYTFATSFKAVWSDSEGDRKFSLTKFFFWLVQACFIFCNELPCADECMCWCVCVCARGCAIVFKF